MMRRSMIFVAAVAAGLAGGCTESSGPASSGASDTSSSLGSLFSVPPWSDSFTLLPVDGANPLRMSTSIGVLEWTAYAFPEGRRLWNVQATEHGPVAYSYEPGSLLWSQNSLTWGWADADVPPAGRLVPAGEDVVLYHGAAVRYAWNGSFWAQVAELDVPGWVTGLAFGDRDAIATLDSGLFVHSSDGVTFAAVDGPVPEKFKGDDCGDTPSDWGPQGPEAPQVLATRDGFVALTPANRRDWGHNGLCEPMTWTSADGIVWTLRTPESPFDGGVVVDFVAEREGRFVAVGHAGESGDRLAWTSGDAIVWQPIEADLADVLELTVSSGPLGWTITGVGASAAGVEVLMWTSPDGVAWDGPHTLPKGLGPVDCPLAVGTDTIFGLGGREPMLAVARLVS
jgi:hypothetical protein